MNDFEKLLHGVLDRTDTFLDASYTGRACYARLSNDLRIKAEFIYTSVKDHYNALKLTAISSRNGILDTLVLPFSDYCAPSPRFSAGDTYPHIWTDRYRTDWYCAPKEVSFGNTKRTGRSVPPFLILSYPNNYVWLFRQILDTDLRANFKPLSKSGVG